MMLSIIMLTVAMLTVVTLTVVMLSVVMLRIAAHSEFHRIEGFVILLTWYESPD
jgi:hypothetical protein